MTIRGEEDVIEETPEYPYNDDRIPAAIRDYDWYYAFAWASGENRGTSSGGCAPEWVEGEDAKGVAEPFSRLDVAEVFASIAGEGDGADWLAVGRLHDARFFVLSAGCDYTGWGCQDGGRSHVATTKERILSMGLTLDERVRLGLADADTPCDAPGDKP